ncbi:MAG: 50S ribosomal protein L23 [Nitrospinae bacterium]|nr:50S ribosomal protein L23 [Nitrospinota bacterium]MBF0633890.1 50S ribosomal protein L23 [Nitrospinota bacterium]
MSKNQHDLIRKPIITEKAGDAKDKQNKITFAVDPKANKMEVKKAVESIFKVKVDKINIINVKGKPKKLGRSSGKRADWKKAVVTVSSGQTIEVFDQV